MRIEFLKACLKGDLDKIKKYFDDVDDSARVKGLCLSIRHQRDDILNFFFDNNVCPTDGLFKEKNLYRLCNNPKFINKLVSDSYFPTPSLIGFLKYFLRNKKFELFLEVAKSNEIEKELFDLYKYSIEINSLEAFDFLYNNFPNSSFIFDSYFHFYFKSLSSFGYVAARNNSFEVYKHILETRKYNIDIIKNVVRECFTNAFYDMINYIIDNYEFDDDFLSTILSNSVEHGCAECLEKLIKKGVDCTRLSSDLLKDCISKGYYKTFRVLLENGVDFSFLEGKEIILHEHFESVKILRDLKKEGISVKVCGANFIRNTRLSFDDLKFVLDNYKCSDSFIRRVFAKICEVGSREQVVYLLDKYPFLENHITEGLYSAISSSSLDVIDYLTQMNKTIDDSVWEEVIKKGNCKVYEFFIKRFGHCSPDVFKNLIQSGNVEDWSIIRCALKEGININKIMPNSYSGEFPYIYKFYDFLVFLFKEGYVLKMRKNKIDKLINDFYCTIFHSLFDISFNSENLKVIDIKEF